MSSFTIDFEGSGSFVLTGPDSRRRVKKILGILTPEDVPVVKCIGLNYAKHIREGRTPSPKPSIFLKARTSITSYDEDVPVPKLAQDDQCGYEGEPSIVIDKNRQEHQGRRILELCGKLCFLQ